MMSTSKVLLFAALMLCLPLAAFANSTVDSALRADGSSTPTNSYITTGPIGTTLTSVSGYNGGGIITGSNLGTINFTTGALVSGGMGGNATFAPGGSIVINSNGSGDCPSACCLLARSPGPPVGPSPPPAKAATRCITTRCQERSAVCSVTVKRSLDRRSQSRC